MCGVFGFVSDTKIKLALIAYPGMFLLQHRGQEGAGVAFRSEKEIITKRRISPRKDSVNHVYLKDNLYPIETDAMIGQNRYSTNGSIDKVDNVQPIPGMTKFGNMSIVQNGNLRYADTLRKELIQKGVNFSGDSDTEIILKLIASSKKKALIDAVIDSLKKIQGSYSLMILTENEVIAARDPYGFRPLSIAKFDNGHIVASESCAFDAINKDLHVKFLRDVEPGEIIVINSKGTNSIKPFKEVDRAQCIFELIYFSRPDSIVFGCDVWEFRRRSGKILACESQIELDLIIPIPDSAIDHVSGFAEARRIPWEMGLVRNHYSGRTFIDPEQLMREDSVRLKFNPKHKLFKGKRTGIFDDSIVRGTTMRKITRMIRGCGSEFIAALIGCPMVKSPCYFGIDTPTKKELIAAYNSRETIRESIEADYLHYLSLKGLKNQGGSGFCYACLDGNYPF